MPAVRFPRETAEWGVAQVLHIADQLEVDVYECGSYLRGRETVKDLDVMVVVPDGRDMADMAGQFGHLLFGTESGGCRVVRGRTPDADLPVDLYFCRPDEAGAMRMFLTGPAEFNIWCRKAAIARGYKLNQYGLFGCDLAPVCDASRERDIFDALGICWLTPEEREDYAVI